MFYLFPPTILEEVKEEVPLIYITLSPVIPAKTCPVLDTGAGIQKIISNQVSWIPDQVRNDKIVFTSSFMFCIVETFQPGEHFFSFSMVLAGEESGVRYKTNHIQEEPNIF